MLLLLASTAHALYPVITCDPQSRSQRSRSRDSIARSVIQMGTGKEFLNFNLTSNT